MKSIKYLSMFLMLGIVSLAMTSCLGNDNDPVEKISPTYYAAMSGNYSGSVQYMTTVDGKSEVAKTEGIVANVTADSTIKVLGLPAEVFTKNIKDEAIQAAIAAQSSPVITTRYLIYSTSNDGLAFWVYPIAVEFKNVVVDGTAHNYTINFVYPSNGRANSGISTIGFNVYMAALYDGDTKIQDFVTSANNITDNVTLYIECKKSDVVLF